VTQTAKFAKVLINLMGTWTEMNIGFSNVKTKHRLKKAPTT